MSIFQNVMTGVQAVGGVGVLGLMVRAIYRSLSKTHRRAVEADTTQDLVDISLKILQPAEEQIVRLSTRLADTEARADKLMARIKELESEATIREKEMTTLREQIMELKTQLLDAQLEVVRLQAMLAPDA